MDQQDLRTLKLLEAIENDTHSSQRDLAKRLDISLGLVNSFIKRLSNKGYFKISTIPKNRIKYILTPKGFAEKTRLTYEYVRLSYHFYKNARQKLHALFQDFTKDNIQSVIFYGAGDLAEIAYISLLETPIELIAVVDDTKVGHIFFEKIVENPTHIPSMTYDRIIITLDDRIDVSIKNMHDQGIPSDKVATLF